MSPSSPAIIRSRPIPPPPRRGSAIGRDTTTDGEASPARSASSWLVIRPWHAPDVDEEGHDPRSHYVERFWLGILGPTATWVMRRIVAGFDADPDGYALDLVATARTMGLAYTPGRSSPFARALDRCVMFGLAHRTADGLAVRPRMPDVALRHLRRLPPEVQHEHDAWTKASVEHDDFARAHRLAVALLEYGDDPELIEARLRSLGVAPRSAAEVADNARQLRVARTGASPSG